MTGGPLAASDLTKLTFHKNAEGKYHCPVLFKVFNAHSHIVAVKPTGCAGLFAGAASGVARGPTSHSLINPLACRAAALTRAHGMGDAACRVS